VGFSFPGMGVFICIMENFPSFSVGFLPFYLVVFVYTLACIFLWVILFIGRIHLYSGHLFMGWASSIRDLCIIVWLGVSLVTWALLDRGTYLFHQPEGIDFLSLSSCSVQ
jgi:hypothetical protein